MRSQSQMGEELIAIAERQGLHSQEYGKDFREVGEVMRSVLVARIRFMRADLRVLEKIILELSNSVRTEEKLNF